MTGKQVAALARITAGMYWTSAKEAFAGLWVNWWVILLPIPYALVFVVLVPVVSPLGLVGGLILGLISAFLLTHFLTFIQAAVRKEKLTLSESVEQAKDLFSPVISVLFILWLISMVIEYFAEMSSKGSFPGWIVMLFNLLLATLFNPLIETIIFGGQRDLGAFSAALEFMRENAVEWLLPLVAVLLLISGGEPRTFLALLAAGAKFDFFSIVVVLGSVVLSAPMAVLWFLLGSVLLLFVLIFRGALFLKLSSSSRRRRLYQAGVL